MFHALAEGLFAVRRSWGLAVMVLLTNLVLAAVLAVPLAGVIEQDLQNTQAGYNSLYGFDYSWWSRFSEQQTGWVRAFEPGILGIGFAFKNLELLLKGELPLRLFATRAEDGAAAPSAGLDAVILGLGCLYLVVQTFLAGGILGVFRSEQGTWTVRGLLHGSGFYFGRLARVALIALLVDLVIFRLNAPLARFVDRLALESVSESAAMAWTLSRHAALLLSLLFVHMVSSYAKAIVVIEERSSAVLAFLSSLSFCLSRLFTTAGHFLAIVLLGVLAMAVWNAADSLFVTTGYKTQLVTLALAQAFLLARIGLRLSLLAGQMALYRKESAVER